MRANTWATPSGAVTYSDQAALAWAKHEDGSAPGMWRVFSTAGAEVCEFVGTMLGGVNAVVDDFGNLVRVQ